MFKRSILLLVVAAGLGCSKASYGGGSYSAEPVAAAPPADYGYGPEYDYDHAVAFDGDDDARMATMESEAPMDTLSVDAAPAPRSRADRRMLAKKEVASPAPERRESRPPASRAADPSSETAEPAIDAPEHELHDRQIIYTANMAVSVFNLEEAMKKAELLPEGYGGYIHSMSHGRLVMRVPSKHLRRAMEDLADLGVVEQRSLQAQDVTAEFTDIDSRIRVLEETQKQMVELLAKARTVDEALAVRRALDQITMELEVLKGRLRQLENMISYSTLTVSLVERGPHVVTPSSRDPFPWVDDLGVEATEWK
jgi:hypothetical protein